MSEFSEQDMDKMATDMFFSLGTVAGALSVPGVRQRLNVTLAQSPECDLMYAVLCRLYSQLGEAVKIADMQRLGSLAPVPNIKPMPSGWPELLTLLSAVLPEDAPDGGEFDLDKISALAQQAKAAIQKEK